MLKPRKQSQSLKALPTSGGLFQQPHVLYCLGHSDNISSLYWSYLFPVIVSVCNFDYIWLKLVEQTNAHIRTHMYMYCLHWKPFLFLPAISAMLHVSLKCARLQHRGQVRKARACGTWSIEFEKDESNEYTQHMYAVSTMNVNIWKSKYHGHFQGPPNPSCPQQIRPY